MKPCSLASIDRLQWLFTATQLARYSHVYAVRGGIHCEGSLSPFDLFDEADTAMSARASERSFANASRWAAVHDRAPESHASLSATTWSISNVEGSDVVTPSYADHQSPATTLHPYASTWAFEVLSAMSTSSRVSHESPSASTQCLNIDRE